MAISIRDVSFAGSSVKLKSDDMDITIKDFMDDANPVEFQDCEVSGVGINCNGNMIRYAKPTAIMMSVTVIPGSDDDNALYNAWKSYRINGEFQQTWEHPITATVTLGNQGAKMADARKITTLKNGTFMSGPAGVSANGEGKMQGRTYTFAFAEAS